MNNDFNAARQLITNAVVDTWKVANENGLLDDAYSTANKFFHVMEAEAPVVAKVAGSAVLHALGKGLTLLDVITMPSDDGLPPGYVYQYNPETGKPMIVSEAERHQATPEPAATPVRNSSERPSVFGPPARGPNAPVNTPPDDDRRPGETDPSTLPFNPLRPEEPETDKEKGAPLPAERQASPSASSQPPEGDQPPAAATPPAKSESSDSGKGEGPQTSASMKARKAELTNEIASVKAKLSKMPRPGWGGLFVDDSTRREVIALEGKLRSLGAKLAGVDNWLDRAADYLRPLEPSGRREGPQTSDSMKARKAELTNEIASVKAKLSKMPRPGWGGLFMDDSTRRQVIALEGKLRSLGAKLAGVDNWLDRAADYLRPLHPPRAGR